LNSRTRTTTRIGLTTRTERLVNFYDFHIGDYASRTGHLEPMEDLAYRRMLDLYYVREAPLPKDPQEVAKLIRMRSAIAVVESVLKEFFTLTERGWEQAKCEEVVAAAQEKRTKAQASANKRWHSEGNANAMPAQSEGNAPSPSPSPSPKEHPPTPRKRRESFDPKAMEIPGWLAPAVWFEWCDDRKERGKPITERAAKKQFAQLLEYDRQGYSAESVVAHSIAGGFQGLYPPPKGAGQAQARPTSRHTDSHEATQRLLAEQRKGTTGMPAEVRQFVAQVTGKKVA
jgi:uncharacterized protein YdaU (DUF1376 family)